MNRLKAAGLDITVLPGGLAVITERLPHVRSVALGISFRVGGRNDPDDRTGIAHMIEHMVFKGTSERDAVAINIAAESHGAELNAFTDKENTCFYGRFPADQFGPVTALLNEIVSGPEFAGAELAREQQVVTEEIQTTNEDPDSAAVNLLFEAAYGARPMGRPIAGTLGSVAAMTRDDLRTFYRQHYGPECAVAVATGEVEHGAVVAALAPLLERHDGCRLPALEPARWEPPGLRSQTRSDLSQTYVTLAGPAMTYADPRRYALFVLNTALGGGMSSRLFQRLREREALVYSVASFTELFSDSGLLGVYLVTDRRKLGRCLEVMREEIATLRRSGITAEEFERARNMTKSSILLALESPTSRMLRLARSYQLLGRTVTVDETVDALDRLKIDDVTRLIDEMLAGGFAHAGAVGPLDEAEFAGLLELPGRPASERGGAAR